MRDMYRKLILGLVAVGFALGVFLNETYFSRTTPYITKRASELQHLLKESLGLPDMIEASAKVPRVAFIDQVILHELIDQFPEHQIDPASYDTHDHKVHVVPSIYKKSELIVSPFKKEEQNHCDWMVRGFLSVAGEGDHQIYLPSNTPLPVENSFVLPHPQWRKVIKRLKKGEKIDIINCSYSYGNDIYPHESYEAVKRGALVIVSAGNEYNKEGNSYRNNFTKLYKLAHELNGKSFDGAMLVVGAYNPFEGKLADYSNRPFPGNAQSSEHFVSAPCCYIDGNKAYMNGGTSIAASYVSAVAALLMKKHPHFSAREIADLIRRGSYGAYNHVSFKRSMKLG